MKKTLPAFLAIVILSTIIIILPFATRAQTERVASSPAAYRQAGARFRDFYNAGQADSLFSLYSPRVRTALPPDRTKQMLAQLHTQLGQLQSLQLTRLDSSLAYYKATFDKSILTITLSLDGGGQIDGFHFLPYQSGPAKANDSTAYILKTPTGNIYGSLTQPVATQKMPVVLIIAGSGPTDRDGNAALMNLHSDMYKIMADSLSRSGIASLRYDKRGIGASIAAVKAEDSLKFEDLVGDAAGFIRMLRADGRFSKIIVLGHSEGSLIGMLAAAQAGADAYISAAGAGDRIDKVIEPQLAAQSAALAARATVLFDSLARGMTVQEPHDGLVSLFRTSIQPYMISWLRYNPQTEIRKLTIPVLILQGDEDLQTTVGDAEKLKRAKPDALLQIINGMNHVFREVDGDRQKNVAAYNDPSLPLHPELIRDIVGFVRR